VVQVGFVDTDSGLLNGETATSDTIEAAISAASSALSRRQKPDGHWVFELEADATIPAEYVILEHFLGRIDPVLEVRIGRYLRRIQGAHGGWPLYHEGKFDLSATVKAYLALKMIGDDVDAVHMRRARAAILAHGGAERSNVFTRFQLALFGFVPWRAVPVMPAEIVLLPRWFFFNMYNVSYWSRTVLAPMVVLAALRPKGENPHGVRIDELFRADPKRIRDWIRGPYRSWWGYVFKALDIVLRPAERLVPGAIRRLSIRRTLAFIEERLNGDSGLGAIYPAMANTVMLYHALGTDPADPNFALAWGAVQRLLVDGEDEAYCQPCVSPIWDTGLAGYAMAEKHQGETRHGELPADVGQACDWLRERQITNVKGDWAVKAPDLAPGGWAFQYTNDHYPDVDDTAVVGMLLHRQGDPEHADAVERARCWVIGMQSRNGGWGAFDIDNDKEFLNHIPFADHGALLDPPTADVSARCLSFLAQMGHPEDAEVIARGVAYLKREQEPDGSWFGRWGTNYIYGTWSCLSALNAVGIPHDDPVMRRGVEWLLAHQRADGGWGESCESYEDAPAGEHSESLPSQTSWALLGLMAAGECGHPAVARGVAYLTRTQQNDGEWVEQPYNAVGFPKVFYLKYHGYRLFFPLLALSRYRNLARSNSRKVAFGF
jgi:squalene-hopene/tetraprenyl-beta-curcumene cyclase